MTSSGHPWAAVGVVQYGCQLGVIMTFLVSPAGPARRLTAIDLCPMLRPGRRSVKKLCRLLSQCSPVSYANPHLTTLSLSIANHGHVTLIQAWYTFERGFFCADFRSTSPTRCADHFSDIVRMDKQQQIEIKNSGHAHKHTDK